MNQKNILITLGIIIIVIVGYFILGQQPANDDNLTGQWKVTSVQQAGTQLVNESNATIEFLNSGTYKATGGCNEMFQNSYKLSSAGKISFQTGGTKKKCADNVVEFWDLGKVHSYQITGTVLLLKYTTDDGREGIFRLQKI